MAAHQKSASYVAWNCLKCNHIGCCGFLPIIIPHQQKLTPLFSTQIITMNFYNQNPLPPKFITLLKIHGFVGWMTSYF